MSHPIQVSPGRYVNLSGAPLPPNVLLRQKIRMILFAYKFTHNVSNFQERIAQAIEECEQFRAQPYHRYPGYQTARNRFGPKKPKGRKSEELLRLYLTGVLWETWFRGTHDQPVVNNKGYAHKPFVKFVTSIFALSRMGKVQQHLEDYQSYRQATFEGKSYATWVAQRGRS
jgi:hypothetical protein